MKPCGRIEHAVKSSGSRSPHSSPTESSHCGRSTPLKCPQGSSRIWCLHAAPALTERSAAADVPRATSTKRVLVIDDNVDVAEMLGLYLQQIGHEVIQAHDGPSGRDAALQHQPKVIVCDIGLPGLDGYEVARTLRRAPQLQSSLLVAVSGYGESADRDKARVAGFSHHITKPAEPLELAHLIANGHNRNALVDRDESPGS